ncbi:MAG: hypothetical protein KJN82_01465 [Bacteroidia bacterium]|nr:hypothetical protein [Bacteroidia bacterium]
MKTKIKLIKKIVFLFFLILSLVSYSQKDTKNTKEFIRVYNLKGKKISKGYVQFTNDSILGLKKGGKLEHIKIRDIGRIKTKRSAGHNVFLSATVGGGTLGLFGAATADPDAWILGYTAAEGFAGGVIIGGATGAVCGGITGLLKNSKTYEINGDSAKMKLIIDNL